MNDKKPYMLDGAHRSATIQHVYTLVQVNQSAQNPVHRCTNNSAKDSLLRMEGRAISSC